MPFNVQGNPQLDSESVLGSTRKLARNKDQHRSQERNEDNPRRGSCGKLQRGSVCDSSGSFGKLQRGVENQLERTRLDYHNMQISDYRYVEKVFEKLRQRLRLISCTLDAKTNVLIWGLFVSTTIKSPVHLGLQYLENLVAYQTIPCGLVSYRHTLFSCGSLCSHSHFQFLSCILNGLFVLSIFRNNEMDASQFSSVV